MTEDTNPYDRVPYTGGSFPQTHPSRLATVAALFGVPAPAPAGCRVLELGCGNGANLVPMAASLPDARFVGIDLAAMPIAQGRARIERLGLANLRLEQGDVTALDGSLGRFDYVIAHGLYSWVPASVRPHVLRVIGEVLADDGVGFVSYNALPGCRMRHLVREMVQMHFGTDAFEPAQVAQVRAFLQQVASIQGGADAEFLTALQREIDFVSQLPDDVLYHDDLAGESHAFLLTDVVDAARVHGLQFLGSAVIAEMFTLPGFPDFDRMLEGWSGVDRVRREQHLDFVRGRRFRQTLLCRAHQPVDDDAGPRRLRTMCLRASLRPPADAVLHDRSEVRFADGKRGATVDQPVVKAMLATLAERWPDAVRFDALVDAALRDCAAHGVAPDDAEAAREALAGLCWSMVRADLIELLRDAPSPAARPGARPRLRPEVADALLHGISPTDRLGHAYLLDGKVAIRVALAMDGSRDRAALRAIACEADGIDAAEADTRIDGLLGFLHAHAAFAA